MTGQGVIGRDWVWCGLPAVGEVEVQPALYRMVSRRDPVTGRRATRQAFVRAAILAAVCGEHQQIATGQAPPVALPRQCSARGVDQLDLFGG